MLIEPMRLEWMASHHTIEPPTGNKVIPWVYMGLGDLGGGEKDIHGAGYLGNFSVTGQLSGTIHCCLIICTFTDA